MNIMVCGRVGSGDFAMFFGNFQLALYFLPSKSRHGGASCPATSGKSSKTSFRSGGRADGP